ncbi:adrenodoxin reductase [Heterostelium album PN500]|uniref:NADPH:adrenodoxin oxidoreductase, mitochondrial n=1 Tax=Heterostelium pallidum (strain ATCC 26659 / Pp 5 / PN500) TaxID=670386 RepID=D3AWD3_HETP5|nr:adrenodoxin reductase [Heterostelium album PN500]EFA86606.1 adrenodoxin reductase [Heterostelium album PN500]|eukprot:XP_020438711.1 adrenodoxin reductase [Heterostelium album PN500]
MLKLFKGTSSHQNRLQFFRNYCTTTNALDSHSNSKSPLQLCIIGSGPAGLYTANRVYKLLPDSNITIIEKLPYPFGLIRYGISPDHQNEKKVKNTLEKTWSEHPSTCKFVGNVNIDHDITFEEIRKTFHAVVLACGIEGEKKLNIPGEKCQTVYSAREFVSWLNGHPDFQKKHYDLQHENVVIVGQGNVALDVARMLVKPIEDIAGTDITSTATDILSNSKVKNVHIIGRRGPAEVSFTTKEVREILKLPNINTYVNDITTLEFTEDQLNKMERAQRKMVELFKQYLKPLPENFNIGDLSNQTDNNNNNNNYKNVIFHFKRSPVEMVESNGGQCLAEVILEKNELVSDDKGDVKAVGTGVRETLKAEVVFRSIGYTGTKFSEVPFDFKRVKVPNRAGRVLEGVDSEKIIDGLYVSGWIKTGPSGAIVNVSMNADETAHTIQEDYNENKYNRNLPGYQGIVDLLKSKEHNLITYEDWKKVENEEFKRGKEKGKILEKIIVFDELKNIIK